MSRAIIAQYKKVQQCVDLPIWDLKMSETNSAEWSFRVGTKCVCVLMPVDYPLGVPVFSVEGKKICLGENRCVDMCSYILLLIANI